MAMPSDAEMYEKVKVIFAFIYTVYRCMFYFC